MQICDEHMCCHPSCDRQEVTDFSTVRFEHRAIIEGRARHRCVSYDRIRNGSSIETQNPTDQRSSLQGSSSSYGLVRLIGGFIFFFFSILSIGFA